jgi:serine/threonine protein kinase
MSELSPSGAPPPLPDRYEFLEPLGQGGLGSVFKARDAVTGRVVAVKTVSQRDDRVQALLMREARLVASLSHPAAAGSVVAPLARAGSRGFGRFVVLAVAITAAILAVLAFAWVGSSGTLAQSSGSTALWTVAAQASEAQALCQVSDGYETVPLTLAIPITR